MDPPPSPRLTYKPFVPSLLTEAKVDYQITELFQQHFMTLHEPEWCSMR
jgi:hypothetical protein